MRKFSMFLEAAPANANHLGRRTLLAIGTLLGGLAASGRPANALAQTQTAGGTQLANPTLISAASSPRRTRARPRTTRGRPRPREAPRTYCSACSMTEPRLDLQRRRAPVARLLKRDRPVRGRGDPARREDRRGRHLPDGDDPEPHRRCTRRLLPGRFRLLQPDGYPIDKKSTISIDLELTGAPHYRSHPGVSQDLSP